LGIIKQFFRLAGGLLLLQPALWGCSPQELPESQISEEVRLIVRDGEWSEETRTAYTPGAGVRLSGDEMLTLLYKTDKMYKADIKASPAAQAGVYSFSMPAAAAGATEWYGIMPYTKNLVNLNSSGTATSIRLGPVQFPRPNSFDPLCDYLSAKPFTVSGQSGNKTAEIKAFKRLFAPLCISVDGLPQGSKIYTFTLSLSQAPSKYSSLTGLFYAQMNADYEQTGITNVDQNSMGNAVSAEYAGGLEAVNGHWPVWLMVNPITIAAGGTMTVSLSTKDRTYTRTVTIPSSQTLTTEKLNRISINIMGSGHRSRASVTQDFTNCTLGGTKTLTASDGSSLTWVTTTDREYRSSDDGGSGITGAMRLINTSFTFPVIEGKNIVGARIFTHPASRSRADLDISLTVDGTDKYVLNLAGNPVAESMAYKGGALDISLPAGKESLAGLTVNAQSQIHLISAITLFTEDDTYIPTAEDLAVDQTLFGLLNLDYNPLASVRTLYEQGRYKAAADALLAYFKKRTGVVNPDVSLPVVSLSASVQKVADDALPENGYRFAVHAGNFYESYSGGVYTYYSFDDGKGGINWEYEAPGVGTEFYQKHWHYWFLPLAQMYRYSGNEKYFNAWKAQYSDWLAKYPCPSTGKKTYSRSYGYRSWSQLSMATRLDYQARLFEYFISAEGFDFEWLTTFLNAYHEAVEYSRTVPYPIEYSNHRFAQYKGHCLAGIFFPEFKDAAAWLPEAATSVSNYFPTAFLDDGCLVELDASYHTGEVDQFSRIYRAALLNGKESEFGSSYLDKLLPSCTFVADYCYPDATWEWFNDTRAQSTSVVRRWMSEYYALYPVNNKFRWLSSAGNMGTEPKETLTEYRTSGYYMFRSGWKASDRMLIYKNNDNPQNMWHAHRDNGTVGLCVKGRHFLPAPGPYTYGDEAGGSLDAARAEHQATRNHNTVTYNLENIAEGFSRGKYLTSYSQDGIDCVVAENLSYTNFTHRRTVWMVNKQFYVIADAVYGKAAGKKVNLSWHLCKDNVEIDNDSSNYSCGAHTTFADGNNLLIKSFSETKNSSFSAENGLSWCSEKIGERYQRKYYRINVSKSSASKNVRFITVLYPCSNPSSVSVGAQFTSDFATAGESLRVTVNGTNYDLSYSL